MSAGGLARIQAASGLAFAFFLLLHLATTSAAVSGPAAYDGALATLRRVYRPVLAVELLLVGAPAAVHVACAIARMRARRRRHEPPDAPLAHRLAGWVLLTAIGGHVFATRVVPALGSGPADFSYLAYSLLGWPAFMRPYYVVLGAAGAIHLVLGTTIALRVLGAARPRPRAVAAAASVAVVAVVAGVLGMIAGAPAASRARFPEFRSLYERWLPILPPPARG